MRPATADERPGPAGLIILCVCAWVLPGAAHLWLRRWGKGLAFLISLPVMFAIGIGLDGRLFPFEPTEPLVALAAVADLGIGGPYFLARGLGLGAGQVTAAAFEYANTFLIVAGLLNLLVVLDACDTALGRKAALRNGRSRS